MITIKDKPLIWSAWDIGKFIGTSRSIGYVTVEPDWYLHSDSSVAPAGEIYRWFQSQTGSERVEIEVPYVKSVSIDRSLDTDAASCTIEVYNSMPGGATQQGRAPSFFTGTWSSGTTYGIGDSVLYGDSYYMSTITGNIGNYPNRSVRSPWQEIPPPVVGLKLGYPGYFTPHRGASPEALARWGHQVNNWSNISDAQTLGARGQSLAPMALIRTYQGYGTQTDGSLYKWQDAVSAGVATISGTWIIDTTSVGSNGMLVLKCRDAAKLLIEQFCYPPIVPPGLYPLQYNRWTYVGYDREWDPAGTVSTSTTDTIIPITYSISTTDIYYGPNAPVDGHYPSESVDANGATFAISGGQTTDNAVNGYEYWEYSVNTNINGVWVAPWAGPYSVWISVFENGAWQGDQVVPWQPPGAEPDIAGTIVPYVLTGGVGFENGIWFNLPRTYNAQKLRITLNDVYDSGLAPFPWRSGLREVAARLHTTVTSTVNGARAYAMARYPTGDGFWVVGNTGIVYPIGDATDLGASGRTFSLTYDSDVVAAEELPVINPTYGWGFWELEASGTINATDGADYYGSYVYPSLIAGPIPGFPSGDSISSPDFVDMAATNTGLGYWVLRRNGHVYAFGDAVHNGNMDPTTALEAAYGVGTAATLQRTAVAIAGDPTGNGYWIVNRLGECVGFGSATNLGDFNQAFYPTVPTGVAEFRDVIPTADGLGLWGLWDTGAVSILGTASFYTGSNGAATGQTDASAAYMPADSFNTNFWSMSKTNTDQGYRLLQTNGSIYYFGDANVFSTTLAQPQQRVAGNYADYVDIVKDVLLWSGFFLGGTTDVHGNMETTGAWSEEDLTQDIFDKKTIMDIVTMIKEIVGYIFWIDDEGGVRFESANWFAPGNIYEDGTFTSFVPSVDEKYHLTSYGAQLDDSQLRSELVIANYLPSDGNVGTIVTRTTPPGADTLRGMQKPAFWTNEVFLKTSEQQAMAELIGMHIFFSMRMGQVECTGNPCIQLNDQIRIFEEVSSETYIHYVRSISTSHDFDTGVYKMNIGTNWLGDETQWAIDGVTFTGGINSSPSGGSTSTPPTGTDSTSGGMIML